MANGTRTLALIASEASGASVAAPFEPSSPGEAVAQAVEIGQQPADLRIVGVESLDLVFHAVSQRLQVAETHHAGIALQGVQLALDPRDRGASDVGVTRAEPQQQGLDFVGPLACLEQELVEQFLKAGLHYGSPLWPIFPGDSVIGRPAKVKRPKAGVSVRVRRISDPRQRGAGRPPESSKTAFRQRRRLLGAVLARWVGLG